MTCKQEWVDADIPRGSIYLFNDKEDSDRPTRVCRFIKLLIADNQGISNAKKLAHKCFGLKADNEQNSDIMNGLSESWQTWRVSQDDFTKPFVELKAKDEDDNDGSRKSPPKGRKSKYILKTELQPEMKAILVSIQKVFNEVKEGNNHALDSNLKKLVDSYTKIARTVNFNIARKPGFDDTTAMSESEDAARESE